MEKEHGAEENEEQCQDTNHVQQADDLQLQLADQLSREDRSQRQANSTSPCSESKGSAEQFLTYSYLNSKLCKIATFLPFVLSLPTIQLFIHVSRYGRR